MPVTRKSQHGCVTQLRALKLLIMPVAVNRILCYGFSSLADDCGAECCLVGSTGARSSKAFYLTLPVSQVSVTWQTVGWQGFKQPSRIHSSKRRHALFSSNACIRQEVTGVTSCVLMSYKDTKGQASAAISSHQRVQTTARSITTINKKAKSQPTSMFTREIKLALTQQGSACCMTH